MRVLWLNFEETWWFESTKCYWISVLSNRSVQETWIVVVQWAEQPWKRDLGRTARLHLPPIYICTWFSRENPFFFQLFNFN